MSVLRSSPGARAELSGSHQIPHIIDILSTLNPDQGWGWKEMTRQLRDVDEGKVPDAAVDGALDTVFRGLREKHTLEKEYALLSNSVLILTPRSLPPVNLPYMVRYAPAGEETECFPCMKPRYYLVLFNTHTAAFTVKEFHAGKQEMVNSYEAALCDVLDADARFKNANMQLSGPNAHNVADFHRVAAGTFRHFRLVHVSAHLVEYGSVMRTGAAGVLEQAYSNQAKSLNGRTGSWKRMLEVAKISYAKHNNPVQTPLASGIADFIGLWASTTGDVSSLVMANGGFISADAPFVSSKMAWLGCLMCANVGNPDNHTKVKYRFDTVAAWQ